MRPLDVEIIHTSTCPAGQDVRGRIEALARDEGISLVVTDTTIDDPLVAKARRIPGSPTVLVDGRDLESPADGAPTNGALTDYGLGWRTYLGPGGSGGEPSDELLLAALRAAAGLGARQRAHWTGVLGERADRYGLDPSAPAEWAAEAFRDHGAVDVLELGAGQGRDSLHFARLGMNVHALDFAESGAAAIRAKAREAAPALAGSLHAAVHDCCEPLPFPDASFDACYSHMLFCMALTTEQLERLSAEVRRVLRPGGLHVYTARTNEDPDYGTGVAHGDDMYESNGFVVHFFSRELVERLADGFTSLEVVEFEEGELPRRLFRVVQRRQGD